MMSIGQKMGVWFIALCLIVLCDGPVGGVRPITAFPPGRCLPNQPYNPFCRLLDLETQEEAASNVAKRTRCMPGMEFSFYCKIGKRASGVTDGVGEAAAAGRNLQPKRVSLDIADCSIGPDGEVDPVCEKRRKRMLQRRGVGSHCIPGSEFSFYCRFRKADDYFSQLAEANLVEANGDDGVEDDTAATGIMLNQVNQE